MRTPKTAAVWRIAFLTAWLVFVQLDITRALWRSSPRNTRIRLCRYHERYICPEWCTEAEECTVHCNLYGTRRAAMNCSMKIGCVCRSKLRDLETKGCVEESECNRWKVEYEELLRKEGKTPNTTHSPELFPTVCGHRKRFVDSPVRQCEADCSRQYFTGRNTTTCFRYRIGCICKELFIANLPSYECLNLWECRNAFTACADGEEYVESGDMECRVDCRMQWTMWTCNMRHGCVCKKYHVRNADGERCIHVTTCDKKGLRIPLDREWPH